MNLSAKFTFFALLILLIPGLSQAGISIVGDLSYEKVVQIGETYQVSISIKNTGKEPAEVKIYQTDYLFFSDGKTLFADPGSTPRSNADWISFNPKRVVIPPQETTQIYYLVKVPRDENLIGTYWSVFMVEAIPKSSPESTQAPPKDKPQVGLTIAFRYAIQMVTQIGTTGASELKFLKTRLVKEEGKRILQVDLENVGEKWLRPALSVELYDTQGNFIERFEGEMVLRIYPGTSIRHKIDLSRLPKGNYKALVIADCGGDDIFGGSYLMEFKD